MEILDAYKLACSLHRGQVDKAGRPYIEHLTRVFLTVSARGGDRDQMTASLLHDCIEDGKIDAEGLLRAGVPGSAVALVATLTRTEGQDYAAYLDQVKGNDRATLIKICDVEDNADPARLGKLPDDVASRLRRKYDWALGFLAGSPPQEHSHTQRPRP